MREFEEYDLGFLHIDIKHLPKLQVIGGEPRKRHLDVAIDRAFMLGSPGGRGRRDRGQRHCLSEGGSRHLSLHDPQVLTDPGSCFTADAFEAACRALALEHQKTKPYIPKTNGMVERFNGRIGREVLVMCIGTHQTGVPAERLQSCLQRSPPTGLGWPIPDEVVSERLKARPELTHPTYQPPDPRSLTKTKIAAQLEFFPRQGGVTI
ncbi:Mobile element protein [Azospirillum endophyticum]